MHKRLRLIGGECGCMRTLAEKLNNVVYTSGLHAQPVGCEPMLPDLVFLASKFGNSE